MKQIAERRFRIKSDPKVEITVQLNRPVIDGNDWRCDYSIHWPLKVEAGRAYGVDGLQALLLAIQRVGVDIYTSDFAKNGDLYWLEEGRGFGLILPNNLTDLYLGDDPPG